jgi:HAD superfamily hydrolase (TIGR01509 family)
MIPASCLAIIFDLDGVLWNSRKAHEEAYRQVLMQEGLPVPPYDSLAGIGTQDVMTQLLKQRDGSVDKEHVFRLTAIKQDLAYSLLAADPPLVASCNSILRRLSTHFRLALATSGSRRSAELFLNSCGCRALFETVIAGNEVEATKPAPNLFNEVISRLNVEPTRCLVVEDSLHGIEAARRAGIPCIAVTGTHNYNDLAATNVLAVVESLEILCPS